MTMAYITVSQRNETTKNIKTDTAPDLNKESFTDRPVPNLEAIYGVEGPEIYYLERSEKVVSDH